MSSRTKRVALLVSAAVAACLAGDLGWEAGRAALGGCSVGGTAYAAAPQDQDPAARQKSDAADRLASAAAFAKAAPVLLHPRCVNCHPAGDRPLVGDGSKPHPMHVVRGQQGFGKNGLWCSSCHQEKNLHGQELPPGAPEWQLPPADMPMVFEKKSPRQLCEQLKDPARNGYRTPDEIVEHVAEAPLVLWGWHPGDGRTPVDLPHDEFVRLLTEWAEKGAACP